MINTVCCKNFIVLTFCWSAICWGEDSTGDARELCVVQDPQILEASGLAICRTVKNAVWMHNDSGDKPRLFLVGFDGATIGIVNINAVTAFDWEDVCSFEIDDESWLLVGDIGDNARKRSVGSPACQLLLLKEPTLTSSVSTKKPIEMSIDVFRTIEFQFADGPHDCESLAVDTTNKSILLVTKSAPTSCAMYSLPLTLTAGKESLKAEQITPISAPFATAMDLSPDNRRLAIVSMFGGAMLIRKDPNRDSWSEASLEPLTLPNRKQGESVCFTADGNSLLLNSEGAMQPLWKIELVPAK